MMPVAKYSRCIEKIVNLHKIDPQYEVQSRNGQTELYARTNKCLQSDWLIMTISN